MFVFLNRALDKITDEQTRIELLKTARLERVQVFVARLVVPDSPLDTEAVLKT